MRRMGFTILWDKLGADRVQTLRFTRRDKDWYLGEVVNVVYRPRQDNVVLGIATIIAKGPVALSKEVAAETGVRLPTEGEAHQDGFKSLTDMLAWFRKVYRDRVTTEPANIFIIQWENPVRTRARIANLRETLEKVGKHEYRPDSVQARLS